MEINEKEIFERLTAVEQSLKSLHKRQDHSDELIKSIYEMSIEIKNMREDLNGITEKVEQIELKPAKRWDAIIAAIIGAVGGSAGTAIISLIFKLGGKKHGGINKFQLLNKLRGIQH